MLAMILNVEPGVMDELIGTLCGGALLVIIVLVVLAAIVQSLRTFGG